MVVSNRDKNEKSIKIKLPVDRKLAIASIILISIATIGFTFLNYHVEPKIGELEDENYDCKEKQMMSADYINKSNYYIEVSKIFNDHYRIIKLLSSKDRCLLDSIEKKEFQMLRGAGYNAVNSAISSGQIGCKNSEALIKKIHLLADSLKLKKELLDTCIFYDKKGANGTDSLDRIIERNRNDIARYKKNKNRLWPFFLGLQSLGIILGIWATVMHKEVTNDV